MTHPTQAISRMIKRLHHPRSWIKGTMRFQDRVCLLGAAFEVLKSPDFDILELIANEVDYKIRLRLCASLRDAQSTIAAFNDQHETTHAEVLSVLTNTIHSIRHTNEMQERVDLDD